MSPDTATPNAQGAIAEVIGRYLVAPGPLLDYLTQASGSLERTYADSEWLFKEGDPADGVYLILTGDVDLRNKADTYMKRRGAGDIIGEQAYLRESAPGGTRATRKIGAQVRGEARVLVFEPNLIRGMPAEIRCFWFEYLAHLLNAKLDEATDERVLKTEQARERDELISRFCDRSSLGVVKDAVGRRLAPQPTRHAVIWFSDIAGFSGWAKEKSPHEVADGIAGLMAFQADIITAHGGQIDKFIGDGLMGFWFTDPARPDTEAEAVRAAYEVSRDFEEAARQNGTPGLSLRIGLHCGDVCFGDFGTKDRISVTILGEPVNLAARFEQLRASDDCLDLGVVRVSGELRERLGEAGADLEARLKGPVSVRVKKDVFDVYWLGDD